MINYSQYRNSYIASIKRASVVMRRIGVHTLPSTKGRWLDKSIDIRQIIGEGARQKQNTQPCMVLPLLSCASGLSDNIIRKIGVRGNKNE